MTIATVPTLSFARETITDGLIDEGLPLLQAHYNEIAAFKEFPLEIDRDLYLATERLGIVRCYVAREDGRIVGYNNYFLRSHPHFKSSMHALSDILYIAPEKRGSFAMRFLAWCEEQLRADGAHYIYQSVTTKLDFGHMLTRLGYSRIDSTFSKRLNKEG